MSQRRGRNNRNKNNQDGNRKGPQIAGAHAQNESLLNVSLTSPPRNKEVPASNVNKEATPVKPSDISAPTNIQVTFLGVGENGSGERNLSPQSGETTKRDSSPENSSLSPGNPQAEKSAVAAQEIDQSHNQVSPTEVPSEVTTKQVNTQDNSNNSAVDGKDVPVHDQDGKLNPDSDNQKAEPPWKSILLEVQSLGQNLGQRIDAMGTRMDKLDKIAATTESLNEKLLGVMQHASNLESKVKTNETHIKAPIMR